ncbi:sulfur carrier protein ThiS [Fodinibius roseus]|uniref:Sulfur carrier protein ThiS n=1 Tax=Fodinibius roseus TaxID=1194090 RepID=A0A1M5IIW6_9BACT|nr:sulfur carrier protein ThiS [Fodinibius roseus]SHG28314.1 sulfur carrier protein ThiS [Fodinibius roseus]
MKLIVNGEQVKTETDTLEQLLHTFELEDAEKGVAVAVNDAVVTKDKWPDYQLDEQDRVEIIRATQGG